MVKRDVHVQIIRRVITHRTLCFYSPNTLFLKASVHKLISFIYFSTFYVKTFFSKELNNTSSKYELYDVYFSVEFYAM